MDAKLALNNPIELPKSYLTGNIRPPKKYIHNLSPAMQHKRKCSICKHAKVEEINAKIKTLRFKTSDYALYGIAPERVDSHILYLNLYPDIAEAQVLMNFKTAVRCNDSDATVTNIIAFTDQINKQAGVYQADKREPLDTAITEIANALLGSRLEPTDHGELIPQSQTEIDTGTKEISADKSMD